MHYTFKKELISLFKLAFPLAIVQLGYQLTGLVDTAFAGRIDDISLAATGLGTSVFFGTSVIGIGIALGLDPLISQTLGAGESRDARHLLWQGIYVAILITIPLSIGVLITVNNLEFYGIPNDLAEVTRSYVYARLLSLLPLLCSVTLRSYLQAARRTRPILWATVWTNIFNLIADYILIFGDDGLVEIGLFPIGLPSYGVVGIGWASVVATVAQFITLAIASLRVDFHHTGRSINSVSWLSIKKIFRVGFPVGLHLLAEVGIFVMVQVLMGGIGIIAIASNQVTLMLASFTFSVCVGIGSATAVQVGRAIGKGNQAKAKISGFLGIGMGACFMIFSAVLMWIVPDELAGLLSKEENIIKSSVDLIRIAAIFQIVDGIQTCASGALRGAGITRWTFIANLIGHWVIGLPLGVLLTFRLNFGPAGLWWGLTAGLTFVAFACTLKFKHISQQTIKRL